MADNNASRSNTIKKGAAEELPENVAQNMPKLLTKGEPEEAILNLRRSKARKITLKRMNRRMMEQKRRLDSRRTCTRNIHARKSPTRVILAKSTLTKKSHGRKTPKKKTAMRNLNQKALALTCLIHIHCEGWKAYGTKGSLISKMSKRNWKSLTRRRRSYTKKKKNSRNGLTGFTKVSGTSDLEINRGTRSRQQLDSY